jgi:DNA-binding NarL/FixJ family response regulator
MKSKISILIAEDHALLRSGIRTLLDREPDMQVIGEAATGEAAVQFVRERMPDVVLMDLNMPGRGGLAAIAEIVQLSAAIKILVVTMHKTDEYIYETLRSGVVGYILKESAHDELVDAIRRVLEGKIYVSPEVSQAVISHMVSAPRNSEPERNPLGKLSERELEVFRLVAEGYANKQVARQLNLSVKTVEKHRSNVMRKLNLRNAANLVSFAISVGLIKV